MEIDSKPESMDRLDRRLIQLKIEREAIKKETDEASRRRLGLIEVEIERLQHEYSDLDEIWKSEKAAVQGAAHIKEEIDKVKVELARLQREGKLDKVAELQYGRLPTLEGQLKAAEATTSAQHKPNQLLRTQVGAEENRRSGVPCDWHSGEQDDAGRTRQAAADGRQVASAGDRPG